LQYDRKSVIVEDMQVKTLKAIREKKGWSRYKMAQVTGMSESQVKYVEEVAQSINTELLLKYFDLSDMTPEAYLESLRKDVKKARKGKK
jgi:transcriptional regulator with XRE-family HTH domain